MDNRKYLATLRDSIYRGDAVDAVTREFAEYLLIQIESRLADGRGMDCDEYRALLRLVPKAQGVTQ